MGLLLFTNPNIIDLLQTDIDWLLARRSALEVAEYACDLAVVGYEMEKCETSWMRDGERKL